MVGVLKKGGRGVVDMFIWSAWLSFLCTGMGENGWERGSLVA